MKLKIIKEKDQPYVIIFDKELTKPNLIFHCSDFEELITTYIQDYDFSGRIGSLGSLIKSLIEKQILTGEKDYLIKLLKSIKEE